MAQKPKEIEQNTKKSLLFYSYLKKIILVGLLIGTYYLYNQKEKERIIREVLSGGSSESMDKFKNMGIDTQISLLKSCVFHEEKRLRYASIQALGDFGLLCKRDPTLAPKIVPILIQAFQEKNQEIQQIAAVSLGKIGSEATEAMPVLIQALEGKDPILCLYAARTIEMIGPAAKEAIPALLKILKDEKNSNHMTVLNALAEIGPQTEEVIPALLEALKIENSNTRHYVLKTLEACGYKGVTDLNQNR